MTIKVILDDTNYDDDKKTCRLWIHFTDNQQIDYPATIMKSIDNVGGVFCGIKDNKINTLAIDFPKENYKFFEQVEGIEISK